MNAEQAVREAWPTVYCNSYDGLDLHVVTLVNETHTTYIKQVESASLDEAWTAALAYTEERGEQIRLKWEEIDSTKSDVRWFAQGGQLEDRRQEAIHQRILTTLEQQYADLVRPMRAEWVEKVTKEKKCLMNR